MSQTITITHNIFTLKAVALVITGVFLFMMLTIIYPEYNVLFLAVIISVTFGSLLSILFVYFLKKGRFVKHKITLSPEKIIVDTDKYHKERDYYKIDRIYYKDGIIRKGLVIRSQKVKWFIPGTPEEVDEDLQKFVKIAAKKAKNRTY